MNQAVLNHRPSTSLNNTGRKPVTMVMATNYCCIIYQSISIEIVLRNCW